VRLAVTGFEGTRDHVPTVEPEPHLAPKRRGIIVTSVNEPTSVDTSASVCEPPSAYEPSSNLSAEDVEMLKELEESIRANGMDSQDLCGDPQGRLFCWRCKRCTRCRKCVLCKWS
jgi:hypothetical protein